VSFGVAAAAAAAAIVLRLELAHDARSGRDGVSMMGIGVADDHIRALRDGRVDTRRGLLQAIIERAFR
jgi:hypothetical protein